GVRADGMSMAPLTLAGSCSHGAPVVLPVGPLGPGLQTDATPCRPGVALRSIRAASRSSPAQRAGRSHGRAAVPRKRSVLTLPDSRARHPCLACRDPRPSVRGSPALLFRRFGRRRLSVIEAATVNGLGPQALIQPMFAASMTRTDP